MTCCIVKGCSSVLTPSSPIVFHCIPKNPERKRLWLCQLSLEDIYNKNARVCSLHFRKDDYILHRPSCLRSAATPLRWQVQHQPRFITISNGIIEPPANNLLAPSSVHTENGILRVASRDRSPVSRGPSEIDKVCRACLAAGRGALALRGALREAYEQLSGEPLSAQPGFPRRLCWECGARVLAAARFRHKARRAHRLLAALCPVGGHITLRDIASIDRRQHDLESQLSCKHFDANAYQVHVSESQAQINGEMEENEDLKEEIIDDNLKEEITDDNSKKEIIAKVEYIETEEIYDNQNEEIFEDVGFTVEVENIACNSVSYHNDGEDDVGVAGNAVSGVRVDSNQIIEGVDSNEAQLEDGVDNGDSNEVNLMDEDNDVKLSRKINVVNPNIHLRTASIKKKTIKKSKACAKPKVLEGFTVTALSVDEQIAEVQKRRWSRNYTDSEHKCEICYRGFRNKHSYAAHALKHTEKYGAYECTVCKCRHASPGQHQKHLANSHKFRCSCNKCDFVTFHQSVAATHSKYHAGTKYQCPHCPQHFQKATSYYSHVRYKHPCALPCPLCGHTFASQRGMEKHKKTFHLFAETVNLQGPHCDTCDVTFASEDAHAKHLKLSSRHRSDSESIELRNDPTSIRKFKNYRAAPRRKYACEMCGQQFDSRAECGQHFEWAHPGETRAVPARRPTQYICDQCGNKFQRMTALKLHIRTHSGEVHECSECGKRFGSRVNLLIHSNIHRAVPRTYACGVCGKRFSSHCSRRRHVKSVHLGVKKYECEACGKRFVTATEIRSHIDHVHNKIPWPKRQRRRARTED